MTSFFFVKTDLCVVDWIAFNTESYYSVLLYFFAIDDVGCDVHGMDFFRENLPRGGKFLGYEFSRGNFTLGGFNRITFILLLYYIILNYCRITIIFSLRNFSSRYVPGELSEGFFPRVLKWFSGKWFPVFPGNDFDGRGSCWNKTINLWI